MTTTQNFWTTDRIMHLLIGLAIAAALILLIDYLSDALLPFFAACFISYMLQPLVLLNRRLLHEPGRVFSSLLTIIEVTAIITLIIYIFLPGVITELDTLGAILHDVETGRRPLSPEFTAIIDYVHANFNPTDLRQLITGAHLESVINKGTSLLGASLGVILQVLGWAMTLIYIIFILIYYPQISNGFKLIVPYRYRQGALSVVRDIQNSMNRYFRAQGLVALCAMIFYCTGFSIIRLPLAIPMGVLVGILYMIPYFQYVTLIPVAIICLIYSFGGTVTFLALFGKSLLVYLCSQSICDYIITPHVMGREMGLNPALILLSLSVWGTLLGIIGMIIALPVTSLIISYYTRYISSPRPNPQH